MQKQMPKTGQFINRQIQSISCHAMSKRKRRIAAGSGTRVEDVNKLLKQYEMMQKMMKQFKKSPKGFACLGKVTTMRMLSY